MIAPDRSFMAHGKCRGLDPALFFPERGDMASIAEAKAVCAECPMRAPCRDYAHATAQEFGVWGGETAQARLRTLRRQRTADPGQHQRPCAREACGVLFAPVYAQELYCGDACRAALKSERARRRRAA
jgi:WhiB family transcriptional regulator, redox-sensing transcriptional regulator